jgi:hypothetical protein
MLVKKVNPYYFIGMGFIVILVRLFGTGGFYLPASAWYAFGALLIFFGVRSKVKEEK